MTENDPTYQELYEEIMAQIDAIEARSRLMHWPITSVASGTWTYDLEHAVLVKPLPSVRKPKPIRAKVRYTARWRKEQIERKLRRV